MFKDLKRTIGLMAKANQIDESSPMPQYHDDLERLNTRLHPVHQQLKIVQITAISPNVKVFRGVATREDHPLAPFRAGQYIGVKVNIDGITTGRAYSLVSSPNNLAYYEFAVKDVGSAGFVSPFLCQKVKVGDIIDITEPKGDFYHNPVFHGKDLVFIAGGCGVTPFVSLMRDFTERDTDIRVHLIFGCLTEKDILFKTEFDALAALNPRIRVDYVLSEPSPAWTGLKGFVTKDILKKLVPSWDQKMIYFVGPELMRELILKALTELNVPAHRILCEVNVPPADITKMLGWPKDLTKKAKVSCKVDYIAQGKHHTVTIPVNCTEPLLNAIERAKLEGVVVPNACRAGVCAFCRTHLKTGEIFVPSNVVIRSVDRKLGYIHPCVSYPTTDIHIELYLS